MIHGVGRDAEYIARAIANRTTAVRPAKQRERVLTATATLSRAADALEPSSE
jgi:hypothetical protein